MLKRYVLSPAVLRLFLASFCFSPFLTSQEWTLVDDFSDGSSNWTQIGVLSLETSDGFLRARLNEASSATASTSTAIVSLPSTYSSGQFTIAFDFYLPSGDLQNQAGFGIASEAQVDESDPDFVAGWGPIGARNRFQTVNPVSPQNMAKVPEWSSDIFGGTGQGVWYNVWLVYDLDADPMTVTTYTKKAGAGMDNLVENTFSFNEEGNDDWSAVAYFGIGVGSLDENFPVEADPWESHGLSIDNIYVADGSRVEAKPVSFSPEWMAAETFPGSDPEGNWDIDSGIDLTVENGFATIKGAPGSNRVGAFLELPESVTSGTVTLTFDLLLPGDGSDRHDAIFSLVGEAQASLSGPDAFGGNDRFITFGNAPQSLTKYTEWTLDLLDPTTAGSWYHVWLVYDVEGGMVTFHSSPFGGPLPSGADGTSFDLAASYEDFSRFAVGAEVGGSSGIAVDNLYLSRGRHLEFSPTAGLLELCGNPYDGEPGVKDIHLGPVDDTAFPHVYVFENAAWVYVDSCSPDFGSLETGYFLYDFESEGWFYVHGLAGAWRYSYSQQSWLNPPSAG